MSQQQIILLERVENLGEMGEVVNVKPGYARNFLLPQGKALRATKDNVAYFEAQKKAIQADSENKRKDAEALAKKMEGTKVALIRQASESGQLFGSVTARDIADAISGKGFTVNKTQVSLNQNFKMIGLFPVNIVLHPEVKTVITLNIARSNEEAEIQENTGKALIAGAEEDSAAVEDHKEEFLEDSALEAEKEAEAEAARLAEEEAEKARKKAEKKAAAKAEAEAEEAEDAAEDESTEETDA
ncbi:MAG: 50S ribosomal protein L9 [Pseudobdellovibrionaceae bacterium]